VEDKMTFEW